MSETTRCTPEKLLEGFAKLSPEDQDRVRAELLKGAASGRAGPCCDPTTMMDQMMERMKATGRDPMAMCKEMMEKMQAGGGSAPGCCDTNDRGC